VVAPAPQPTPPAVYAPPAPPPVYAPPAPTAVYAPPAPPAAPPPAPPPAAGSEESDHDHVVGHFGVTYFGISQLPIADQTGAQATVVAPVIGIRYWLKPSFGIDVGVGLGANSGSVTSSGTSQSTPGAFGFALHGGLPFALASSRHYAFELIPEVTLGLANGSYSPGGGAPSISLSGLRVDIGARAGAELHFGFIGIPQLSLVASVGLYIHDISYSATPSGGQGTGGQQLTIATSVQSDPWSIFTDNVSAIYYF
jgi:hypothetical protein